MTLRSLRSHGPEGHADRAAQARRDFLATPCDQTADTWRERSYLAWRARNGSSVGFDGELDRIEKQIRAAMAAAVAGR